jgi:hypothetical protein
MAITVIHRVVLVFLYREETVECGNDFADHVGILLQPLVYIFIIAVSGKNDKKEIAS